ncbi:PREDICTED: peptidoglycan-recognition protein SB1-like [Nicrophorus vespilloides]|uniref:Peptidoglycan-recognition protein n=1 Tax=Nicrophorus vespilloides TaxID=110193 RepID=A0ABM1NGJ5_NICVS|nr:PREDICTED: peptidoglycan-recognition protein SB1-like [Nicrophorus vespilloides]
MVFYKCSFVFLLCVVSFAECFNVITRSEWGARAPRWAPTPLSVNPASHVIIHHGDSNPCTTRDKCTAKVKIYQADHINNRRWSDIGYNFVVGEDGNVYEGRGWGKQGSHAAPYNEKSIGISVIGRFDDISPNSAALNAVKELIAYGVANGKIQSNYKLVGHRQVKGTKCPGQAFYNIIKTWPNYAANP